jgi:DNA-binding response OmpR family regulator
VVDVCVRRLRAKVSHDVIQTVRNVGYQLQSA